LFHIRQIITRIAKASFQKEIEKMYYHNYENSPKLKAIIIRPVLSAMMMGVVTWGSYRFFMLIQPNDSRLQDLLVVIIVIILSALVYVAAVIKTKAFTKEDLEMIPKGKAFIDRINKKVHKNG